MPTIRECQKDIRALSLDGSILGRQYGRDPKYAVTFGDKERADANVDAIRRRASSGVLVMAQPCVNHFIIIPYPTKCYADKNNHPDRTVTIYQPWVALVICIAISVAFTSSHLTIVSVCRCVAFARRALQTGALTFKGLSKTLN